MQVQAFIKEIEQIGIRHYLGVPDSTLKPLCDYLNHKADQNHHMVTVNEGAAVALAAGLYIGNEAYSCVYMQNSGIGNAMNPIISLIHEKVYDIPMLFLIGYRGEPGTKDEPQHVFQGEITLPLLELLQMEYAVLSKNTTLEEFQSIMKKAEAALKQNKQYAIVVKKGSLQYEDLFVYDNGYTLHREQTIHDILASSQDNDLLVTTTGKISREAYEQSNQLYGHHHRIFLTVGSMGHASMIALGIAKSNPDKRIFCIDGDGAALMHMGSMNYIAHNPCDNFVHIVLNNAAHESVGGMPTNCQMTSFAKTAEAFGYRHCYSVCDFIELTHVLSTIQSQKGPIFIEIKVALGARADLGRPKESAVTNKNEFMEFIKGGSQS